MGKLLYNEIAVFTGMFHMNIMGAHLALNRYFFTCGIKPKD